MQSRIFASETGLARKVWPPIKPLQASCSSGVILPVRKIMGIWRRAASSCIRAAISSPEGEGMAISRMTRSGWVLRRTAKTFAELFSTRTAYPASFLQARAQQRGELGIVVNKNYFLLFPCRIHKDVLDFRSGGHGKKEDSRSKKPRKKGHSAASFKL